MKTMILVMTATVMLSDEDMATVNAKAIRRNKFGSGEVVHG